jgi:hypothetical protein
MRIPRDLEALTLVVALALCLIAVPAASATPITYVCGQDLCRVRTPGRSPAHLTHRAGYSAVLNVRDSTRVAYQRAATGWWLADHDLGHARRSRGDGFSTDARGLVFITSALPGDDLLCITPFGGRRRCGSGRIGFVEWWRTRLLYGQVDTPRGLTDFQQRICLLTGLVHCSRVVARAADNCSLRDFDVAPDGRLLVAAEYCEPMSGARLALWDVRTGRLVRTLTGGHDDHHASFSPDGRLVVFDRDYNVYDRPVNPIVGDVAVVPARGGAVHVIARGHHPAWTP